MQEALQKVEEEQYAIEAYEESLLEREAYAIAIQEAFQESPRPFCLVVSHVSVLPVSTAGNPARDDFFLLTALEEFDAPLDLPDFVFESLVED